MKKKILGVVAGLFIMCGVVNAAPYGTLVPGDPTNGKLGVPYATTLPATCGVGYVFFDSDGASRQQTYICSSTDTWTLIGGGAQVGTSLPASCDAGDIYYDTNANTLNICTASDTWTNATIDTKCLWFENPVDTDDFESIWTADGFTATITKMWCESDQTVNLDLQIDDGTPADVNGTDLVCSSSPDTANPPAGDTTMANGDRLDLSITSVASSPSWVSICWTLVKGF